LTPILPLSDVKNQGVDFVCFAQETQKGSNQGIDVKNKKIFSQKNQQWTTTVHRV